MEITILEKTIIIHTDLNMNNILEQINHELTKNEQYYSHFLADGTEIFEDILPYLEEHFDEIKKIEVIGKTKKQFTKELFLSMESYLSRAIPELECLSQDLYNNDVDVWNKVSTMLEGVNWIYHSIYTIDQSKLVNNWDACLNEAIQLQEKLSEFEQALINKDLVLLSDIVKYEIFESIEKIKIEVTKVIDNEVIRANVC